MRFFLDTDHDGHWYVIPADKQGEWSAFLEIDIDDPRAWEVPEWAQVVGGAPSLVTFENPEMP